MKKKAHRLEPVKSMNIGLIHARLGWVDYSSRQPGLNYVFYLRRRDPSRILPTRIDREFSDTIPCKLNYFFPLITNFSSMFKPEEVADLLEDLPVAIVEEQQKNSTTFGSFFDRAPRLRYGFCIVDAEGWNSDQWPWAVTEAYMRLNFLPPILVASLPPPPSTMTKQRKLWVLSGLCRTSKILIRESESELRDFQNLAKSIRQGLT